MKAYLSHSSTLLIETGNVRIACDPWYSEPIFDGGWLLPTFTPSDKWLTDLLDRGLLDYIYISHIHPDHYDAEYLSWLASRYRFKILLADWSSSKTKNHLKSKMLRDGLKNEWIHEAEHLSIGDTNIRIVPWDLGGESDVDSAIIVTCRKYNTSLVNLNDCIYDAKRLAYLNGYIPEDNKKLVFASYSPAGSYPHTYLNLRGKDLDAEARGFRERFLSEYKKKCEALSADYGIPCAGGFSYAIKQWNKKSGRPDYGAAINCFTTPTDLVGYDSLIEIDSQRKAKAVKQNSQQYVRHVEYKSNTSHEYSYTLEELVALVHTAYQLACGRIRTKESYTYIIIIKNYGVLILPIDGTGIRKIRIDELREYMETGLGVKHIIAARETLLYKLLCGDIHWDNAEKGSLYNSFRSPNIFSRTAQSWLHYFFSRCQ